jgi:hypothetical protein
MSAVCREGHLSDEPDYCSVCGAPILSGSATPAAGTPMPIPASARFKDPVSLPATCPSCGEPREDASARYCEVCRYDFIEQRPGPPPVARGAAPRPAAPAAPPAPVPVPAPAPSAPAAPSPAASVSSTSSGRAWELVVAVDPALDTDPDPQTPCPVDKPEVALPVGRHDDTRSIHPELSLHDPGASRRHAKFVLDPDGTLVVQDLASTNGTQVNGQDLPAGTRRPLREGDRVTIGRWTRITVRVRA